jgi:ACS family sodium-dependent inorganic phosphate cotransporter-like MFS transporter 5
MSVAIVCMINNTALKEMNDAANALKATNLVTSTASSFNNSIAEETSQCLFQEVKGAKTFNGEFAWNKKIQGLVLSSYFYGYITTQVIIIK